MEILVAITATLLFFGILVGLSSKYAWLENKIDSNINETSEIDKYTDYEWKL